MKSNLRFTYLTNKLIFIQIVPAVAKLAQDGSQEARSYAKATLVMFMEGHPDWERVLKKNLTQNTMRYNPMRLMQLLP